MAIKADMRLIFAGLNEVLVQQTVSRSLRDTPRLCCPKSNQNQPLCRVRWRFSCANVILVRCSPRITWNVASPLKAGSQFAWQRLANAEIQDHGYCPPQLLSGSSRLGLQVYQDMLLCLFWLIVSKGSHTACLLNRDTGLPDALNVVWWYQSITVGLDG